MRVIDSISVTYQTIRIALRNHLVKEDFSTGRTGWIRQLLEQEELPILRKLEDVEEYTTVRERLQYWNASYTPVYQPRYSWSDALRWVPGGYRSKLKRTATLWTVYKIEDPVTSRVRYVGLT